MLSDIHIQNILLIDDLALSFDAGLVALTGETGAGKSILLESLALALGGRGSPSLIRPNADVATVTATLHGDMAGLRPLFADAGLDAPDEDALIIRRQITRDGRSKAYVNDQAVSTTFLKDISGSLIEIQGQFEQHGLLHEKNHRMILDRVGGLDTATSAAAFDRWQKARTARIQAENALADATRQQEYLCHCVEEFERLRPQEDEEKTLTERKLYLSSTEKIQTGIDGARTLLDHEGGAYHALAAAVRQLETIQPHAAGRLDAAVGSLKSALLECQEAMLHIDSLLGEEAADPRDLEQVDERLHALRALARKHRIDPQNLVQKWHEMANSLTALAHGEDHLDALRRAEMAARNTFVNAAEKLSMARQAAAARLDTAVRAELAPLKLDKAEFKTIMQRMEDESHWSAHGMDTVSFHARTNAGLPFGALAKIASGGELSRFLLAFKGVMAAADPVGTLVFDEVDSGVGGATADAVGQRLAALAHQHQVLVVTHSPQVAGRAAQHFVVEKSDRDGTTRTTVRRLSPAERQEEIARMLSGATITDQARQAAKQLMVG